MTQRTETPPTRHRGTAQRLTLVLIEALLTGLALIMSRWAPIHWVGTLGFAYLGLGTILAELSPEKARRKIWIWGLMPAWIATLTVPLSCWLMNEERIYFKGFLDHYYAVLAWVIAGLILPVLHSGLNLRPVWKAPMMAMAGTATLVWIGTGYVQNEWSAFHVGMLLMLGWLLIWKWCFPLPALGIQFANTLILIAIGLPLAGWLINSDRELPTDFHILKKYYCYRTAKENWKAYSQWCDHFGGNYTDEELHDRVLIKNNKSLTPIRLRPNSHARFAECDISINSKGFRGREISEEKGNNYRIVVLGESTTFGYTIERDAKPWPELFEAVVRNRIRLNRPVEVINAGIPALALPENLDRFPDEILPLKPDLIVCYHGINGFYLMDNAVPPLRGKAPPRYARRPIRLLADAEYNLKLLIYKRTRQAKLFFKPPSFSNLMATKYAAAYEDLIQICKTNGIRLAIANFPLAANLQSPPEILDFHEQRVPGTYAYVRGNVAHNELIQGLVQKHPEVIFVNARPHIDGEDDLYVDLMHLTQEGDQRLAENFFADLRPVLEAELSPPAKIPEPAAVK